MHYQIFINFVPISVCDDLVKALKHPEYGKNELILTSIIESIRGHIQRELGDCGNVSQEIGLYHYPANNPHTERHIHKPNHPDETHVGILYLNEEFYRGRVVMYHEHYRVPVRPKKAMLLVMDMSVPHHSEPPMGDKYLLSFHIKNGKFPHATRIGE